MKLFNYELCRQQILGASIVAASLVECGKTVKKASNSDKIHGHSIFYSIFRMESWLAKPTGTIQYAEEAAQAA